MKVAGRGTDDVHCPSLLENGLDEIVAALQQPVRIANQQLNFKRHALAHSRRCPCGRRSRPPRGRCAPWRLGGSRPRLDGWDGQADRPIHWQEDLFAVMAHHERRAVE